jgi:two-component system NtrC family sensor kinase
MSDKYRILVVEDSPTQALGLQVRLEAEGWEVVRAATADQALESLDRRPPHLIVVDYYLPGIRGDEFCRRVRMNINTRGIPMIMLTADEDDETEIRGLESGADGFVQKSADAAILMLRIRSMLERTRPSVSVLESADRQFQRARVLAIDDSETYLARLTSILSEEGYLVELVNSGAKGLERIHQGTFDCVLVDLMMPGLDGIAVCREIVALRERLDNPIAVLMLTGREGKDDLTRALEAGADDFVGKSSDDAVLKGRIRALLRRKFFQEENQRILEELKNKELEVERARGEQLAAETRAARERQRQAESVTRQLRQAKAELEGVNKELTATNDELRRLTYVASHDLQEPLRSIASYCSLLRDDLAGRLDERAGDYMERIVAGARRMKSLVQDLLVYAQLDRDARGGLAEVSLDDVVRDAVANLQAAVAESDARIQWNDLPAVMGERGMLVQLMQNLIGNAVKYRGGEPPRIVVEAGREGGSWVISVRDNGIGIAAEHRECIFDVFRRLHTAKEHAGTGIGLSVCRRIVARHGGRIWVESPEGRGSTFRFTLPIAHKEQHDEPAECHAETT